MSFAVVAPLPHKTRMKKFTKKPRAKLCVVLTLMLLLLLALKLLPLLTVFVHPMSDMVVVRSVIFDERARNGHHNSTVLIIEVHKAILYFNMITGCRVGNKRATDFRVRRCFINGYVGHFWLNISHHCAMIDCFDLAVEDSSFGYVSFGALGFNSAEYKSSHPIGLPKLSIKPVSSSTFDFTIAVCRVPHFNKPPFMLDWVRFQQTVGVDHIHIIADETAFQASWGKEGFGNKELRKAISDGYISLEVWRSLPPRYSYYHSQPTAIETCVYRLRTLYDYVMVVDTDDFLVLRGKSKSLHHYIEELCHREDRCGAVLFKWYEFHLEHGLKRSDCLDGNVTDHLNSQKYELADRNMNFKTVYRSISVLDAGVHVPGELMEEFVQVVVPEEDSIVAHIRNHTQTGIRTA